LEISFNSLIIPGIVIPAVITALMPADAAAPFQFGLLSFHLLAGEPGGTVLLADVTSGFPY
jgi:hypothetical protein